MVKKKALQHWQPTINYLNKKLPQYHFILYPYLPTHFEDVKNLIKQNKVDFIISPPAMYIDLEVKLGVSKILTLVKKNNITEFGTVIASSKESNITTLAQINTNTRIAAVAPLGFGGWLIGYDTLKSAKVNFIVQKVAFLGTQERVVEALMHNETDVGIFRTGLLEMLEKKRHIDLQKLTILHPQKYPNFPFLCSTKLYPEWAFSKTKHINDKISRDVALVLLQLSRDNDITKHADYQSWTVPYEYKSARELMQRLAVEPYSHNGSEYITYLVSEHQTLLYISGMVLISLIFLFLYSKYVDVKFYNEELRQEHKEKEILLKQVQELAYFDTLTKMPNRLHILHSFEQMLANAQRSSLSITVMFVDLDGFKIVNDTLGHHEGDRVLEKVAKIFRRTFRKGDLYGRLGGDEFIIMMTGINEEEHIKKLSQKLLKEVNRITLPPNVQAKFGVSIGAIHLIPENSTTVEELVDEADELMYNIKKNGKNSFQIKSYL